MSKRLVQWLLVAAVLACSATASRPNPLEESEDDDMPHHQGGARALQQKKTGAGGGGTSNIIGNGVGTDQGNGNTNPGSGGVKGGGNGNGNGNGAVTVIPIIPIIDSGSGTGTTTYDPYGGTISNGPEAVDLAFVDEYGAPQGKTLPEAAYVPGEMLVQFRPWANEDSKGRALGRFGMNKKDKVASHTGGDLELVHVPPGLEVSAAARRLKDNDIESVIEFAEPNYIVEQDVTSNDPKVTDGTTWGVRSAYAGTKALDAWTANKYDCSTVYVVIIDSCVYHDHPDLKANFGNPREVIDGIDNDGNGYVDDVNGWDFGAGGSDRIVFDPYDNCAHGTHVAGIIGAVGGNGVGVAGVCWKVRMLNGKFMVRGSGSTSDAIKAVDYATNLKVKSGLNVVATTNSWGGGGFSQSLLDAIKRARDADILFIASAGNNNRSNDVTSYYPANYASENVISVASIDRSGVMSSFSSWGTNTVHIGAPGGQVYSTYITTDSTTCTSATSCPYSASYNNLWGTSMAAPHVTGAAALYRAMYPTAKYWQIKAAMRTSVNKAFLSSGKVMWNGVLNVAALVNTLPPATPGQVAPGHPDGGVPPESEGDGGDINVPNTWSAAVAPKGWPFCACKQRKLEGTPYVLRYLNTSEVGGPSSRAAVLVCFALERQASEVACSGPCCNMDAAKVELFVGNECRSLVHGTWVNGQSRGWSFTPSKGPDGKEHMSWKVSSLGWTPTSVAKRAEVCIELLAPCNSVPAFCAGGACRYSIFNKANSCCPTGSLLV